MTGINQKTTNGLLAFGILFIYFVFLGQSIVLGANRIVSISPVITEIIYWLDSADELVGVTTACQYPEAAKQLPKIGDFTYPQLEKIIALRPNYVIGMGNSKSPGNLKLQKLGIKTIIFDSPETIDDIYAVMNRVGSVLHKTALVKQKTDVLKREIKTYHSANNRSHYPPKKVLILIGMNPMIGVSQDTFIDDMITISNGKNAIKSHSIQFPILNTEHLILLNPDIIILSDPQFRKFIENDRGLKATNAYKNHQIITSIDPDLLLRPGPRFIDGIRAMRKLINP